MRPHQRWRPCSCAPCARTVEFPFLPPCLLMDSTTPVVEIPTSGPYWGMTQVEDIDSLVFLFRPLSAIDPVCRHANFIGGMPFTGHQRTVVSLHFLTARAHHLAAKIVPV